MTFLIILELDAEAAPGHGMVLVASDTRQFSVFNFKYHRAGIGTIVWTTAVEFLTAGFELC
jgi:hypothetical protein